MGREVRSVDGLGGKTQDGSLVFCVQLRHGRKAKFEVEGVEVGVSECQLINYRWMKEVEGEEAR